MQHAEDRGWGQVDPAHECIAGVDSGMELTGHTNVDTTLNVYTQVLDGSMRQAVEEVGGGLFTIVHKRAAAPLDAKGNKWCALHDSNMRPPGS